MMRDADGGKVRLTNISLFSRFGAPVLQFIAEDMDGEFGPRDLIDLSGMGGGQVTAAFLVLVWALAPERTNDELAAADMFLRQWPEGPQLGGMSHGRTKRADGPPHSVDQRAQ